MALAAFELSTNFTKKDEEHWVSIGARSFGRFARAFVKDQCAPKGRGISKNNFLVGNFSNKSA